MLHWNSSLRMILMSYLLLDFKCTVCTHRHEALVDSDVRVSECPECGAEAKRVISPVRCNLEGISGHFPDAAEKWKRQHEKAGRMPSETHPDGWK
jgi:putative FmdB family regulatory protein